MAINQWELDSIAAALEGTMFDFADVYRRTGNGDEYGGGDDFVQFIDGVKIGIAPTDFFQFQQTAMGSRQTDITYYACAVPRATAIKVGDLVDVYTQGVKVSVLQVERAESIDTMLKFYAQAIDDTGWFELNLHGGQS